MGTPVRLNQQLQDLGGVASTTHTVTMAGPPVVGDLMVVTFCSRMPGQNVTFPADWVQVNADDYVGDGSSPAIVTYWKIADQALVDAGQITVVIGSAQYAAARVVRYQKDTFYRPTPVAGRHQAQGNGDNPNPLWVNPGSSWGWDDYGAGNDYDGHAGTAFRANRTFGSYGGNWNNANTAGTLSGPSNSDGIRLHSGFETTGTAHVTGAGYAGPNAGSINNNSFHSVFSYGVRGLRGTTTSGPDGSDFSWDQVAGTFRLEFTPLHGEDPYEFEWDFGDGSSVVTDAMPAHTFPGTGDYSVTLRTRNPRNPNSGQDWTTSVLLVTVNPIPPIPAFDWAQEIGGWQVAFQDRSAFADSVLWEIYADEAGTPPATTYTTPTVVHDFGGPGRYLVRLTATNTAGSTPLEVVVNLETIPLAPERPDGLDVLIELRLPDGQWLPLTCDVQSLEWAHGTNTDDGPLSASRPTQMGMTLVDPERVYDADNASSPLYGRFGPGSWIRVRLGASSAVTAAWSGYITDVGHDLRFASFQAHDLTARLAAFDADIEGELVLPVQSASDRVGQLLDVASWPNSLRVIEPGGTSLQDVNIAETNVWDALIAVQQSDLGRIWIEADSTIHYAGRTSSWAETTPKAIFGCDPPGATADVGIHEFGLGGATENLINEIRVGVLNGEPQTYSRQDSIDRWGRFTGVKTDLVMSQGELNSWANFLLDRTQDPSYQGRTITFRVDPTNVFLTMQLYFGDIVRVYDDQHGPIIDFEARVLGLIFTMDRNVCWAQMLVSRFIPLTEQDNTTTIDSETDWTTAQLRADNVLTDPDGVIVLDRAV